MSLDLSDNILHAGSLSIPESEIEYICTRASGAGGQYVNRTDSAVQLRFNVRESPSIPEPIKTRLIALCGNRLLADGTLIIDSQEHRSQLQNKRETREKLIELLTKSCNPPKVRRKTKISKAVKERRMMLKKAHSALKQSRRNSMDD